MGQENPMQVGLMVDVDNEAILKSGNSIFIYFETGRYSEDLLYYLKPFKILKKKLEIQCWTSS